MVFEKTVPIVWEFVCYWVSFFIGLFKKLIVCWEELPDFYFVLVQLLSVSLQFFLERVMFGID